MTRVYTTVVYTMNETPTKQQRNYRLEPELENVLCKAKDMGEAPSKTEALRIAIRRYGSQIGVWKDEVSA